MFDVHSLLTSSTSGSRKRIVTPARKEQNRVAQRAFRQRRKEQRMANKGQQSGAERTHMKPTQIQPYPAGGVSVGNGSSAVKFKSSNNKFTEPIVDLHATKIDSPQETGADSAASRQLSILEALPLDDITPTQTSNAVADSGIGVARPDIWEPLDPTAFPQLTGPTASDMVNQSAFFIAPNFGYQQTMSSSCDSSFNFPAALFSTSRYTQSTDEASLGNPISSRRPTSQIEQQSEGDNSNEPLQSSILPRQYARNYTTSANYTDILPLADPYRNAISLSNVQIVQICILNARCLGIAPKDVVGPDCLSLCSPFYRPVTASDDPKALLAAATKPIAPKYLQPTLPQILFPHHPMLDLIPLPKFRERAIMLSSTSPPLFNPLELKRDIMEGGLICWGSRNDPFHQSNGQPWDLRSWEAAPWFLKKYRLLVGGKDGELWKQSMWWRNLRGEPLEE